MAKIVKFFAIPIVVFAMMVAAVQPALAQGQAQAPVTASVDRTALTTDDMLTLSVVVNANGQQPPQPQLPALDGFYIVGNGTSSQMSIVNGAVSSSVAYNYRLQPAQTGALTIDPVTVTLDGRTYSTQPITVQVSQGTGQPTQARGGTDPNFEAPAQLGDNQLFVQATVDNLEPYVGEQVTYTFRFFEAADAMRMSSMLTGQPDYRPPALTGFWAEGDPEQRSYRASVNGRIYTVTELNSILFPTAAGEVTIDPATLTIPDSIFQRGGSMATEAVTLNVQPLPAGAPASFNGAVGQFEMVAEADVTETRVDEPVTLKVTLVGRGNISTLTDPVWPQMDGWRVFEGESSINTAVQDGQVVGTRVYEHVMIPTQAGEYVIPAIEYSYFDPTDDEQYHSVSTEEFAVSVAPGPPGAGANAARPAAGTADANAPVDANAPTELALKAAPEVLRMSAAPVVTQPWYWLLWTLPLAALAGGFVWQRRQRYLVENAATIRSSRAYKEARRALDKVRKRNAPTADQFAAAERVFSDYLSAKLGRSVIGMSRDALAAELAARNVDASLIAQVQACFDASEHGRYSPAGSTDGELDALLDRVAQTVGELDRALVD